MPLLPCPHCHQKITVTISQAGSQVTCPACQQSVAIPKLGALKQLEAEALAAPGSPDAAGSPTAAGGSPSGLSTAAHAPSSEADQAGRILFGGLLAIAGITAIAGIFCLVRYLAIDVNVTTQSHIQEIERAYKQVPTAQLVREWQQMEKYGLDAVAPYGYQKLQNEKANWARNALICLTLFLIATGLATVLGITDSRRRAAPARVQ